MKKKQKEENKDNFLLYIPRHKHKDYEIKDEHVYLIFHHNKLIERFLRWLVKKPTVSDIKLDDLGSFVWQMIDGNKTVYDIGQELLSKFGDGCQPVYDRLIMYLRYLNRKGWIAYERGSQS